MKVPSNNCLVEVGVGVGSQTNGRFNLDEPAVVMHLYFDIFLTLHGALKTVGKPKGWSSPTAILDRADKPLAASIEEDGRSP